MTETYEIHIDSQLGSHLTRYFDGISVLVRDDNTTVLVGDFTDQAALHGVLATVRDLGLSLLSVNILQTDT